jgi:hypothetical protein
MRVRIAGPLAGPLAATLAGPLAPALAALAVAAAVVSGCTYNVIAQTPTPEPTPTGVRPGIATQVPIGATPWPNGTTGAYGLRIDPSLLSNIPSIVGGNPLVEDAAVESAALDDSHYADAFTSFYAANLGDVTDLNWVQVNIGALQADAQSQGFYTSWRDDWFNATCSQADGIGSTSLQTINGWQVDVATCKGGVDAYTLSLDNGILLSIADFGPRRLGQELIEGIN